MINESDTRTSLGLLGDRLSLGLLTPYRFLSVNNYTDVSYNIYQLTSVDSSYSYDILSSIISKLFQSQYEIHTLSSSESTNIYDVHTLASDLESFSFDIRAVLSKISQYPYDINKIVSNIESVNYHINQLASDALNYEYDILNTLPSTITLPYDLRNLATKLYKFKYTIISSLHITEIHTSCRTLTPKIVITSVKYPTMRVTEFEKPSVNISISFPVLSVTNFETLKDTIFKDNCSF